MVYCSLFETASLEMVFKLPENLLIILDILRVEGH